MVLYHFLKKDVKVTRGFFCTAVRFLRKLKRDFILDRLNEREHYFVNPFVRQIWGCDAIGLKLTSNPRITV